MVFETSRAARTYRICKIQRFNAKVEYLTRVVQNERSRLVEARARTRHILDRSTLPYGDER